MYINIIKMLEAVFYNIYTKNKHSLLPLTLISIKKKDTSPLIDYHFEIMHQNLIKSS